MRYHVLLDGRYLKSFKNYSEACELRDYLRKQLKKSRVEVIKI